MTNDIEADRIRSFLSPRRAGRSHSGKTIGLEEVLLMLHKEGASYSDMVEYLARYHQVKVSISAISKRVRQLLKQTSVERDPKTAEQPTLPTTGGESTSDAQRNTATAHVDPAKATSARSGQEPTAPTPPRTNAPAPGSTFIPPTSGEDRQNSSQPSPPSGRGRFGPRYDSNSPEARERQARLDESIRRERGHSS